MLARAGTPEDAAVLVFDLDPGAPADVLECCAVALRLRELVRATSFVKTSGSVGLHVYVPLNGGATFGETKAFARELARQLAADDPARVTDRAARAERAGKVFVDWLQNDPTRSTVAPYSLRGTAWPTVSTPVTWDEVERALHERRPELLTFDVRTIFDRVDRIGDLFAPVLELEQAVPTAG
jgi:bifunctional non-homologous end joining protein LigD